MARHADGKPLREHRLASSCPAVRTRSMSAAISWAGSCALACQRVTNGIEHASTLELDIACQPSSPCACSAAAMRCRWHGSPSTSMSPKVNIRPSSSSARAAQPDQRSATDWACALLLLRLRIIGNASCQQRLKRRGCSGNVKRTAASTLKRQQAYGRVPTTPEMGELVSASTASPPASGPRIVVRSDRRKATILCVRTACQRYRRKRQAEGGGAAQGD